MPEPGARIQQYEIIRELGRGGMGAVFLARDLKLGRRVAIKFLHSEQPEVASRFILEARVTARLHHENIVIIHDADDYQGYPYMVLEFLQGRPLSREMPRGKSLPSGRVVELMVPVVKALVCAHEHNIVHRDLKPDNIFITDAGAVKVLDFGIAKLKGLDTGLAQEKASQALPNPAGPAQQSTALIPSGGLPGTGQDGTSASSMLSTTGETRARTNFELTGEDPVSSNSELTKHGALMGTLPYMSPEQWFAADIDHRTDIWAIGILLFRMLTGKHPLAPMRGWQLMATAQLDEPMPSIRSVGVDIPEPLADIVDRCLIKHREARMSSAQDLLRALEPLLPGRFTHSTGPASSGKFAVVKPYAGLSAFQEDDADRFHGRSREIAQMVVRLRDQPLVGVVGPSGAGKSSFIRAGVVPALKKSGDDWETLVVRPGRQPLAALAGVIAPLVNASSTSLADEVSEQQVVLQRLRNEAGYLGTVLRSRARRHKRKLLLCVDQFEELYTLVPDYGERLAFTACLSGVADDATSPLRVVLSIRSDFLDRISEDQQFTAELSQGLFFLVPPTREGMREALVQPAESAGYRFESQSMVDHMLDHLDS
ncbi:MAG: serine/threonine-protein kinase, partial [Myxococcota bacterium]